MQAFINAFHHETEKWIENGRFITTDDKTEWLGYRMLRRERKIVHGEWISFSGDPESPTLTYSVYDEASPTVETQKFQLRPLSWAPFAK